MTSSAIHLIGVVLRYFPELLIESEVQLTKMKEFLNMLLLAEFEDQRH